MTQIAALINDINALIKPSKAKPPCQLNPKPIRASPRRSTGKRGASFRHFLETWIGEKPELPGLPGESKETLTTSRETRQRLQMLREQRKALIDESRALREQLDEGNEKFVMEAVRLDEQIEVLDLQIEALVVRGGSTMRSSSGFEGMNGGR
jgi:hypothetical protein